MKVLARPTASNDRPDVTNGRATAENTAVVDRDGQPMGASWRLDAISVAPTVLVVLNIVVEDEYVRTMDEIKVPTPRDVGRLNDCAPQGATSKARFFFTIQ